MSEYNDNGKRISAYLDNQMDEAAEKMFMIALENDGDLKKQFEDEVLLRSLLAEAIPGMETDEIKRINLSKKNNRHKTVLMHLFTFRRMAAAVAIIAGALCLYMVFLKKDMHNDPIVKVTGGDSAGSNINGHPDLSAIYTKHYKKYKAAGDPVELSYVYNDYQAGNYKEIFAVNEGNFKNKGFDKNDSVIAAYLQLYKALAFLADNRADSALTRLKLLLGKAPAKTYVYYTAEWYQLLALLATGDIDTASHVAEQISSSSSPYKIQATTIIDELKIH